MKMGVMIMVGMVWLSMTMMFSSAQDNSLGLPICWAKVNDCLENAGVSTDDLTVSYAVCCPVIKRQVANTKCFCSIKDYIQNIPTEQPGVLASTYELYANKALDDCKIGFTFDQMCNGVSKSDAAAKITSIIGLVPGSLFVWAMIMS